MATKNDRPKDDPEPDPRHEQSGRQKKRVWCILRLRDYGLSGLHNTTDGEPEFERIKATLILTTDREAAFQLARETGGLLCAAESLPRSVNLSALEGAIARLADA